MTTTDLTLSPAGTAATYTTSSKFGTYALSGSSSSAPQLAVGTPFGISAPPWTVELWYKSSSTATQVLVGANVSGSYWLGNNSGKWHLESTAGTNITGSINIADNVWHHLAASHDGTTVRLFVDGALDVSSTVATGLPWATTSTAPLGIGNHFNSPNFGLIGSMDELRISNTARYTAAFTAPSAAFTVDSNTSALYHFENNGVDEVGLYNAGPSNGTLWGAGKFSSAMYAWNGGGYTAQNFQASALNTTIEYWQRLQGNATTVVAVGNGSGQWAGTQGSTAHSEFYGLSQTGTTNINDGNWHHIAITNDGSTVKLWVDGGVEASTSTTNTSAPWGGVYGFGIGMYGTSGFNWKGGLDEVRVSSVVRYTSTFTPPTAAFAWDSSTLALFHLDGTGAADNGAAVTTGSVGAGAQLQGAETDAAGRYYLHFDNVASGTAITLSLTQAQIGNKLDFVQIGSGGSITATAASAVQGANGVELSYPALLATYIGFLDNTGKGNRRATSFYFKTTGYTTSTSSNVYNDSNAILTITSSGHFAVPAAGWTGTAVVPLNTQLFVQFAYTIPTASSQQRYELFVYRVDTGALVESAVGAWGTLGTSTTLASVTSWGRSTNLGVNTNLWTESYDQLYLDSASNTEGVFPGYPPATVQATVAASTVSAALTATATNVAGAVTVPLSGSGALTTAASAATSSAPSLSGTGALSTTGAATASSTPALSGSGTLAATGVQTASSTGHVDAAVALSASAVSSIGSLPQLTGAGALSTAVSPSVARTAALSGSGTLSMTRTPAVAVSPALAGSGTLAATGVLSVTTTGSLAADVNSSALAESYPVVVTTGEVDANVQTVDLRGLPTAGNVRANANVTATSLAGLYATSFEEPTYTYDTGSAVVNPNAFSQLWYGDGGPGTYPDWGRVEYQNNTIYAHSGRQSLAVGDQSYFGQTNTGNATRRVYKAMTGLVIGNDYKVTVFAHDSADYVYLRAALGVTGIGEVSVTTSGQWQQLVYLFTATSTSHEIYLESATSNFNGTFFDDFVFDNAPAGLVVETSGAVTAHVAFNHLIVSTGTGTQVTSGQVNANVSTLSALATTAELDAAAQILNSGAPILSGGDPSVPPVVLGPAPQLPAASLTFLYPSTCHSVSLSFVLGMPTKAAGRRWDVLTVESYTGPLLTLSFLPNSGNLVVTDVASKSYPVTSTALSFARKYRIALQVKAPTFANGFGTPASLSWQIYPFTNGVSSPTAVANGSAVPTLDNNASFVQSTVGIINQIDLLACTVADFQVHCNTTVPLGDWVPPTPNLTPNFAAKASGLDVTVDPSMSTGAYPSYEWTWGDEVVPSPPPPPSGSLGSAATWGGPHTPPTGSGYFSLSTLAGADLTAKTGSTSSANTITLPAGVVTLHDFPYGQFFTANSKVGGYAAMVHNVGLIGSGANSSIIALASYSMDSTLLSEVGNVDAYAQTHVGATTNGLTTLRIDHSSGAVVQDLQILGTEQGTNGYYNGLNLYYADNARIQRVLVKHIPAYDHVNPGETFGIVMNHCLNTTLTDVEVDGDGVGGSGVGLNSSSGGTLTGVLSHNNAHSIGFAYWQHSGGATLNSCGVDNNHGGFNFERCTGLYVLNSPHFGTEADADISGGNDQSSNMLVVIVDPKDMNGNELTRKLKVRWFGSEIGSPSFLGAQNIKVYKNGVDVTSSMVTILSVGSASSNAPAPTVTYTPS